LNSLDWPATALGAKSSFKDYASLEASHYDGSGNLQWKAAGMTVEWHTAFRVLAHEIRSPVGVIAGYSRMLASGRLDEAARATALRQVAQAAARLEQFGHQSQELARWLEPRIAITADMVEISTIIDAARNAATAAERVRVEPGDGRQSRVRTSDPRALSAALTSVIHASMRELRAPQDTVAVSTRCASGSPWCDVLIGPSDEVVYLGDGPSALPLEASKADSPAFAIDRGGLGLQLILGAVIVDAHGGRLWGADGHPAVAGVRLPGWSGE
jgi:K+-sensing histidine kinase KdpD